MTDPVRKAELEDAHLASALIRAGAKADNLHTILGNLAHDLPEGRTIDILRNARCKLRLMAHDLTLEGQYLRKHGGLR